MLSVKCLHSHTVDDKIRRKGFVDISLALMFRHKLLNG